MMKVALLKSKEQANELRGKQFAPNSFCEPVLDGLGRWVISLEEMNGLGLALEVIEWTPPVTEGLEHPTPTDLTNES